MPKIEFPDGFQWRRPDRSNVVYRKGYSGDVPQDVFDAGIKSKKGVAPSSLPFAPPTKPQDPTP